MPTLLALLLASLASGWDMHEKVTEASLAADPALQAQATAETLESYLAAVGGGTAAEFLVRHKLNRTTSFGFHAGETAGSGVSLARVLARYADEPDWAMDQDIFAQYPELWKDEYQYMGGRTGPQTRVFRHMHWPKGFYRPGPDGKPVHDPTPMGMAPERAELFFTLSREAFVAGRPYWGARFLAWALHYIQDVSQPFHAVQLPAIDFLRFKPDGGLDLEATTRVIAFYHLAVDGFPGRAIKGEIDAQSKTRVEAALAGGAAAAAPVAAPICRDAARKSARLAEELGKTALAFMPEPGPGGLQDPVARIFVPGYWRETAQRRVDAPVLAEDFMGPLEEALEGAGAATRALVGAARAPVVSKPVELPEALALEVPEF